MTPDDLVERARIAAEKVYGTQFFNIEIKAVIAVLRPALRAEALEEAAQVCERRFMGDHTREDMEARRCAAAIRAMIPKENT